MTNMAENVDPLNWTVDMDVSLFHAMRGHKPVGVNRYFQMCCIHEKLNNASSKKIPISDVWKHLGEMFDLVALNESEIFPFPNRTKDFDLEYTELVGGEFPRYIPECSDSPDGAPSDSSKSELLSEIKSEGKGSQKIQLKDLSSSLSTAGSPSTSSSFPSSLVSALTTASESSSKRKRTRQVQTPGSEGSQAKRRR